MNFLKLFNPSNQIRYTADEKRCYAGEAPALGTVRRAFGDNVAESWVEVQVRDVSEFAGCKGKMTDSQLEETARIIISEFGYMKVTELMHFFLRFKAGYYGRFYGNVDGLVITEALQQFKQERYIIVSKYEQERMEQERAAQEIKDNAEVQKFRDFLNEYHLTIEDCRQLWELGVSELDEIAEIYWLFKI